MTKDEALKLALEALEYASDRVFCENNDDLIASAITAITQSLAAPTVQPAHISPRQLLALAQEANLGLDKVIEVFRMAAPVQEEDLYDLAVKADNWGQP
jgi:hypothetical protein